MAACISLVAVAGPGGEVLRVEGGREQQEGGGYVFTSERRGPMTPDNVRKMVQRAGEVAGLPFPVHPHMLRHGCGYALANRGYDLRLIQDYLGHRSPIHTMRYTRTAASRFEGIWQVS